MGGENLSTVLRNNPELIRYEDLEHWAKTIYQQAKKNALRRGIKFSLTQQEYAFLIFESSMRCAVSGIPFDLESQTSGSYERRPFYPSLDRMESSAGYEYGNVRLVCVATNLAMNTWGEHVFMFVAKSAVAFQASGECVPPASLRGRKKFPGVTYNSGKRAGAQYGAIVRGEDGGRYIIGWYGTEIDAYTQRLRAIKEIERGTPIAQIGYRTILNRPRPGVAANRPGNPKKTSICVHNVQTAAAQPVEIKGNFSYFPGLPDRDRT